MTNPIQVGIHQVADLELKLVEPYVAHVHTQPRRSRRDEVVDHATRIATSARFDYFLIRRATTPIGRGLDTRSTVIYGQGRDRCQQVLTGVETRYAKIAMINYYCKKSN